MLLFHNVNILPAGDNFIQEYQTELKFFCLKLTIWIAFPIQIFFKLFSLGFS